MVEYDSVGFCNRCRAKNEVVYTTYGRTPEEASTKCTVCEFEDYWAYGFFESRSYGYNKGKKYSYDR